MSETATVTPTPPASLIAKAMAPATRKLPAQERRAESLTGWQVRDVKDSKENVIAAVNRAATVPAEAKALLVAAINEHCPDGKLVRLDAMCQVLTLPNGKCQVIGHWGISEL